MSDVETSKQELAQAASNAVKVVADAASEAAKVVAEAASASLYLKNMDHDLLIRLETKIEGLKEDIKDIKDGTSLKIENHEKRLNELETSKTRQTVLLSIGIAILSILTSLLIYHIVK